MSRRPNVVLRQRCTGECRCRSLDTAGWCGGHDGKDEKQDRQIQITDT